MSYVSPFTGDVVQPTDVSYRRIILTADLQLEWPTNGAGADNSSARIMEVSTASTANELWMPPANQASVGEDALIRNVGAVTLLVKDYTGLNTIVSIAAGQAQYIYITANPTTAGTWGIIAFGIGSSGADAATLAGYGLLAIGSTLNQSQPVTTFSTSRTAISSDRAATYVWTSGAGTITLSSAATLGNNWFLSLRNSGTGALTVACSGVDLINGSASIALQPSDSCLIVCSGTQFYTVGLGKSTQFAFTQLTKAVVSGTYTLTSAEASNVIQKYTGTLTGDVIVIVPATVQVYYILNETVGGVGNYTVTFTTNSGGGVAVIPSNNQVTLVCDSINMFNANTILAGTANISLGNGTVGSPSLNFASESSTGVFRAAAGQFNTSILGVLRSTLSATGLSIVGGGAFTGAVSGTTGTFTGAVSGTTGTFTSGVAGGTFP
jgi:hypothetical protein